jgi:hypothetical protein
MGLLEVTGIEAFGEPAVDPVRRSWALARWFKSRMKKMAASKELSAQP